MAGDSGGKLAWFKWFPADWQSDHLLMSCSIEARGLWLEMLNMMWQSSNTGYLCDAHGAALSDAIVSGSSRISLKKYRSLRDELREKDVFSVTPEGVVFCRKMIRDEEKRSKCSEAGKSGGGNPRLRTFKPETEPTEESNTAHQTILNEFNLVAPVQCRQLTPKRRQTMAQRLRDKTWEWRAAIDRIPDSDFLMGRAGNWKGITIDFFLRPDTVTKILEGTYDNGQSKTTPGNDIRSQTVGVLVRMVERDAHKNRLRESNALLGLREEDSPD